MKGWRTESLGSGDAAIEVEGRWSRVSGHLLRWSRDHVVSREPRI